MNTSGYVELKSVGIYETDIRKEPLHFSENFVLDHAFSFGYVVGSRAVFSRIDKSGYKAIATHGGSCRCIKCFFFSFFDEFSMYERFNYKKFRAHIEVLGTLENDNL